MGALLFMGGIFALMLPNASEVVFDFDTQTFNAAGEFFMQRLVYLLFSFLLFLFATFLFGAYLLPRFKALNPLVLQGEQEVAAGYVAFVQREGRSVVGKKGIAITSLRPSGRVECEGELFDAVSDEGLIERGEAVIVTEISANHLVVTPLGEV